MKASAYWIEGSWPGRLAIVPRPRGGDWLEDEIKAWREGGIEVVVSALTPAENQDLGLTDEARLLEKQGLRALSYPIVDRGVPSSIQGMAEFVRGAEKELAEGKNVAIHCRQGIGRSSILAASLLVLGGLDAGHALERIEHARGCPVPDTKEQRDWLLRFAKNFAPALKG